MRHLKDINMKKAALLLVMTCCTIGLGRVGAAEVGDASNEARVAPEPSVASGDSTSKADRRSNTEKANLELMTAMQGLDEEQVTRLQNIIVSIMGGGVIPEDEYKTMCSLLRNNKELKGLLNSALTNYGDSVFRHYKRLIAMIVAIKASKGTKKLFAFTEKAADDQPSPTRQVVIGEKTTETGFQVISLERLHNNIMESTKVLADIARSIHCNLYMPGLLTWQHNNKSTLYSDIQKDQTKLSILLGEVMSKIIQTYLVLKVIVSFDQFAEDNGTTNKDMGTYKTNKIQCTKVVNKLLNTNESIDRLGNTLKGIPDEIIKFINSAIYQAVSNPSKIIPLNLEETLNEIHYGIMKGWITHDFSKYNKESTAPNQEPRPLSAAVKSFGGVLTRGML